MSTGWILKEINPSELKNHLVNIEIYGTLPPCDEMLASVKEHGVIEPIRCTKDMVVLSGHRRRQHAVIAKLKTVPVLVARNAISEEEQIVQLIESNRQREKTKEVRAREFARLSEAMAELARKRQSAVGGKKPGALGKKVSEALGDAGRAKDQAAAEVGMSRPTAEKAVEVVKVIDELVEAGETDKAEEIRETLNTKSVAAAARAAGVEPKKPPKLATVLKDGQRTVSQKPYDAHAIEKQFGALVRAIDDMATAAGLNNSTGHKQAVGHLSKAMDGFRGFVWPEYRIATITSA
jgi:ParB-like chromosome segregation protein Spo0J